MSTTPPTYWLITQTRRFRNSENLVAEDERVLPDEGVFRTQTAAAERAVALDTAHQSAYRQWKKDRREAYENACKAARARLAAEHDSGASEQPMEPVTTILAYTGAGHTYFTHSAIPVHISD